MSELVLGGIFLLILRVVLSRNMLSAVRRCVSMGGYLDFLDPVLCDICGFLLTLAKGYKFCSEECQKLSDSIDHHQDECCLVKQCIQNFEKVYSSLRVMSLSNGD